MDNPTSIKYKVFFSKQAVKSLQKIPKSYQIKVKDVVKKLEENPFKLDLKKLSPPHNTSHRLRMGSYRLFLDIDTNPKEIVIVDIVRRTSQTY